MLKLPGQGFYWLKTAVSVPPASRVEWLRGKTVEGARMAMGLVREFGLGAVMVCAIDGSSILQGIEEMAKVITEVDLHLLTPAGSRTYSRWKDQWHTTGVLA